MVGKILMIVGSEFEDIEVLYPYYRLVEEGFDVVVAAPVEGRVEGKHGYVVSAVAMSRVDPGEFVALVIPGGKGPERVRVSAREEAVRIVKHFMDSGKPIAAICHGPQLLISAGVVKGLRITSYVGIADDIKASGGEWVDQPVVVDKNVVTARIPQDLPHWMREFIKLIKSR
ncbi:MAG: type 1 glutamine amidotransferase domain-containing protein [Desulfurococcaceae archaeon TW002]